MSTEDVTEALQKVAKLFVQSDIGSYAAKAEDKAYFMALIRRLHQNLRGVILLKRIIKVMKTVCQIFLDYCKVSFSSWDPDEPIVSEIKTLGNVYGLELTY